MCLLKTVISLTTLLLSGHNLHSTKFSGVMNISHRFSNSKILDSDSNRAGVISNEFGFGLFGSGGEFSIEFGFGSLGFGDAISNEFVFGSLESSGSKSLNDGNSSSSSSSDSS